MRPTFILIYIYFIDNKSTYITIQIYSIGATHLHNYFLLLDRYRQHASRFTSSLFMRLTYITIYFYFIDATTYIMIYILFIGASNFNHNLHTLYQCEPLTAPFNHLRLVAISLLHDSSSTLPCRNELTSRLIIHFTRSR